MSSPCSQEALRAAVTSIKQDVVTGQVHSRRTAGQALANATGTGLAEFTKCMVKRELASNTGKK